MNRVELKLNLPVEGKVLLHCCCAPCSSAILECMKANALDIFYKSNTCRRFHDEKTGLYLYGDNYIVEELVREYQN